MKLQLEHPPKRPQPSYWRSVHTLAGLLVLLPMPWLSGYAADTPTFSNEVVRILQQKCQRCHQDGGIAPMPLETYAQVRPWAPRIKINVSRRVMPPWHLDHTIGIQEYKNDFSLNEENIQTLVAWVDAGAPEGDTALLPEPVDWPNWLEWELEPELGPPDMVFETGPKAATSGPRLTWNGRPSPSRVS